MASRVTVDKLAAKLQNFSQGLPPDEQQALAQLLRTISAQAETASSRKPAGGRGAVALVAPRGTKGAVADVRRRASGDLTGGPVAITPTWTITTTVTVAASHPWITCLAARE
jgi:hypothetical protein